VAGRGNEMAMKTGKKLLSAFRLFESLSQPGKRRMRAMIGRFLQMTKVHNS
jgi:hypothetical protein